MSKQKIILKGVGVSPGKIKGKVKVINFPEEISGVNKTEIIVVSFLTPDLLTVVKRNSQISGIITDKGGITCHAAIVARELKIPYIAGTAGATEKLKNDMKIILDGRKGIIYGEV